MEQGSTSVVWMKVIQEWFDLGEANGSWCCEQFRDTGAFRTWDWVDPQSRVLHAVLYGWRNKQANRLVLKN